jgi:hypothetical protein
MNETILELILTAIMGFFMVLGLIGCRKERLMSEDKQETE